MSTTGQGSKGTGDPITRLVLRTPWFRAVGLITAAVIVVILVFKTLPGWLASDNGFLAARDRVEEIDQARRSVLTAAALLVGLWTAAYVSLGRRAPGKARWVIAGTVVVCGVILMVALKVLPPWLAPPESSLAVRDRADAIAEARWSVLAFFAGALCLTTAIYLAKQRSLPDESFEARIARLGKTLAQVGEVLTEIQWEVQSRQAAVERLKQEQELTRGELETELNLLQLSRAEAESVRRAFRGELTREGRKQFWIDVALGTMFFAAGAAVSFVLK